MEFLTAFGLAGENALAHNPASANGAKPKPSAPRNNTVNEKYGFEAMRDSKPFFLNVPVLGLY